MSNQDFNRQKKGTASQGGSSQGVTSQDVGTTDIPKSTASDATTRLSEPTQDAGSKAKQATFETASSVTKQVKGILDKQIGSSAGAVGQLAGAIKLAAEDLNSQSPLLAGFVRTFGGQVENYANDLQNQTIDQLGRKASELTQRQPALVFGLAALAGFFLFRTVKSSSSDMGPPFRPSEFGHGERYHG